jgi:hypothetical protein
MGFYAFPGASDNDAKSDEEVMLFQGIEGSSIHWGDLPLVIGSIELIGQSTNEKVSVEIKPGTKLPLRNQPLGCDRSVGISEQR